jgi:predicted DNA-binding WGR domain protein
MAMNFPKRALVFLKALISKQITVPGYSRGDGTYVPIHTKIVKIDSDHAPKFEEHHLPDTNTNAGTHNKKVTLIAAHHAAGDVAALTSMKHGVNTYGKKAAKLADAAVAHLTTPVEEPEMPKVEAPKIEWEKYLLDEANTNFKSHKTKVEQIKALHEAGDIAGLEALTFGVNTYNKQASKLRDVAVAHLKEHGPSAAPVTAEPQTAAPAPKTKPEPAAAPTGHFGEQHEGEEFGDEHGMLFKFEGSKWHWKPAQSADWDVVDSKESIKYLNEGKDWLGGELTKHDAKAPAAPPPPAPVTNFGEQNEGQIFQSGSLQVKFSDGQWQYNSAATSTEDWKPVANSKLVGNLDAGQGMYGGGLLEPVHAVEPAAPKGALLADGWEGFSAHPEYGKPALTKTDKGQTITITPSPSGLQYKVYFGSKSLPVYGDEAVIEHVKEKGFTGLTKSMLKQLGVKGEPRDEIPKLAAKPAPLTVPEQTYHNTENGHSKFWSVSVNDDVVTKKWGVIGKPGISKDFAFDSHKAAKAAAKKWETEKEKGGYKLHSGSMMAGTSVLDSPPPPAAEQGPKDGDTKAGADGGRLVFKDGHWHKVEEPQIEDPEGPGDVEAALHAVAAPAGLPHSAAAALEKLKQLVIEQGADAFKLVKKQVTSPKGYVQKKMHLTLKGCSPWGGPVKISGWVDAVDGGGYTGATGQGIKTLDMVEYIDALKAAHLAATGGKVAKKKASKVTKVTQQSVPKPVSKKDGAVTVAVIDSWTKVGEQKGSNPGGTFKDPGGQDWYVKFPASADHVKNELLAAKLYKAAGIEVPQLRMVEKDGKVGIASKIVPGVSKVGAGMKSVPGALEGFVVDAWLANHDSVGTGHDNLLKTKEGKAIRIDVGGSLLYRAQGAPKGDLFGNEVGEIKNMQDPKINSYGASVYGGISKEHLINGAAQVLEIPDELIKQIVTKFGPGDDAAKEALAAKLIARKADLAKQFPEADAIANPPAPDPRKLPVDVSKLPPKLDFLNWKAGGKGLSSVDAVNTANQKAVDEIYDAALKGDFIQIQKTKYHVVDKATGESSLGDLFANHPSQHVRDFYSNIIDYMSVVANPAAKKMKSWDIDDYSDINELADAFPAHYYGVAVGNVPANERLGFWISLGQADAAATHKPDNMAFPSAKDRALGSASTKSMPSNLKTWMKAVKASGAYNQPYRDGKETDASGLKSRDVLAAAYEHAVEFEEGTRITKDINFPPEMMKQMLALEPGHVFQNPGSMCCSLKPDWHWGGDAKLNIVYAKGAKALYNIGVGSHDSEGEITTIPGQRFMLIEVKDNHKMNKGKEFTLLMLPPDETYVANIHPSGKV